MRYFHRSSVPLDDVLAEADRYFGARLQSEASEGRSRTFSGTLGRISIDVQAEGGHYTLVTVETDQVGESELDKLAKRFMSTVHQRAEPGHEIRGAY